MDIHFVLPEAASDAIRETGPTRRDGQSRTRMVEVAGLSEPELKAHLTDL